MVLRFIRSVYMYHEFVPFYYWIFSHNINILLFIHSFFTLDFFFQFPSIVNKLLWANNGCQLSSWQSPISLTWLILWFSYLSPDLTSLHSFLKLATLRSYSLRCPEASMLLSPLAFACSSLHLHHRLNGREFEQTLGDSEAQGSLSASFAW